LLCFQTILAVVRHEGFLEVARGDWLGQTVDAIGPEPFSRWNRDPLFAPPGGGEALATVARRVVRL
jgi:broad specificity phosphatase PhoE